jgi:hypothetical protein
MALRKPTDGFFAAAEFVWESIHKYIEELAPPGKHFQLIFRSNFEF